MEENKEYQQDYNREGQMPLEIQTTAQYYPRFKKKKGRWSNQEHDIFINCLKTYGKDWDRLEELIPTRSSLQIRSHCQKYFDQIKKEYKTDNPMEYILKNMCDKSPYYQFDLPQLTDPVQNPQVQMMMAQKKPEVDNPGEKTKKKYLKHKKEVVSSDSSGYFNREDSSNMKKRELKDLLKNMQYSNSSNESKERRLQRESNSDSSDKLFKIQKVSKSREESLSCSNFDSKKDSQHKSSQPNDNNRKYSKDTMLNIKKGSSIALLNKGKIIIQGTRIESRVPGEIQKYDKDLNVIIPDYPCQVYIEPLVLPNKPIRYEANLKVASKSLKEENKNPLMTTGSYSTNATSRRSYTQPSMFQDTDLMKEMEILKNIFCCCVKR